ncbi:protein translocase subunit SecF [Chromohalobacter israelensis]|uniref:Protein-export membrane protein SecF n=1 Tax=Chromohalobacter israelensis (strain ATCC BAA-138 / DSM 3043 / CIP 106854 / NCIMB 13768 / 1H11) TaxID=290398 RepID=Q1QTM6_CHRI1|nr:MULTISPECIES: protein translocase subunit SecF [Chromohalobacter]ABE60182.1 protein translocase subunit secF [Chromohalobacter salexigens DSM 3043]MDO0946046.1 protein translocase subunit SecF [Chromohalobacter salexigens]NQY45148.1 protein translocase subunit SecF [Chromohalobacter sp.]NWO56372.1 protein translocase subunit SecF [Chromohalobacter salexigens]RXE49231.1 protein translocase subunit SecF [Chromohalobacter salexigens]
MRQLDFMGKRRIAFIVSVLITVIAVGALAFKGLNLGLDFTGGTLVEVRYQQAPELDELRGQLESAGFEDVQVQTFGATNDILVRLQQTFDNEVGQQVVDILNTDANQVQLVRAEFVGAQVGDQLRDQSGLGMLLALAVVMVYVAFRFQYKFAFGALVALGHDVVIVLGIFALLGLDFDLTVLAAVLAVIGYSLNDTIIVYDRIRENIRRSQIDDMPQIFNEAINQTLARTMATSGTTLLVLLALFFLGGDMIHNFSIALILGIVAGTFSSVYVSAALLLVVKLERKDLIPAQKEDDEEEELP